MKAAILVEQKKPLVIADIQLPEKLEYGQVLVRIVCSGICGSQIGEINGVKGPDNFLPHLLGHEGGGVVEDIGPGVSRVKRGDRVVMHWRKGFGIESAVPKYKWEDKTVNAGWITTFNEKAVVSENRLTPVPDDVEFEIAALMGCAVTTGLGVVNNNANLKIGESIAVFGAGGVGLNIIQGAAMVSAYPIIAIDKFNKKLEMAKVFGATHTIDNSSGIDVREEIFNITGKKGVDVAVDNTGNTKVIEMAYEVTSTTGRTVLVGVPKKGDNINIYSLPLHFEKTIGGSHGGESNPSIDIPNYIKLYRKGKLGLKEMISHSFRLDDINKAIDAMQRGETIRCMIRMD
jgi:S-(hydroxymethyl)glutathione dehydrogenase/alcohol dehydrogenase